MNFVECMNGYDIIVTTKKQQIMKHKRKRINKKWAKRYGFMYFDIQEPGQAVIVERKIYMTQRDFDFLKEALKRQHLPEIKHRRRGRKWKTKNS